jgi:hypothetical protein
MTYYRSTQTLSAIRPPIQTLKPKESRTSVFVAPKYLGFGRPAQNKAGQE